MEDCLVQLGFASPLSHGKLDNNEMIIKTCHDNSDWREWDGGKIGGKPSWLNPRDVPFNITCSSCDKKMIFLVQLYCPLDDEDEEEKNSEEQTTGFHRTLYVFICPNPCHKSDGIRVFRCQLPQENPFYAYDASSFQLNHVSSSSSRVKLCQLCNQRSKGTCPMQKVPFCSKICQVEYKKQNKQKQSSTIILFPESELIVEEEPPPIAIHQHTKKGYEVSSCSDDEDRDMTQKEINSWTQMSHKAGCSDEYTLEFQAKIHDRLHYVQNQCLRYSRWPNLKMIAETNNNANIGPLWIQEEFRVGSIPKCPLCNSPREFEFQIMPQMLYYIQQQQQQQNNTCSNTPKKSNGNETTIQNNSMHLLTNEKNSFDWGVITIYTCRKSCFHKEILHEKLGAYVEEFAWRQPLPDEF